jgi:hypothetical protein
MNSRGSRKKRSNIEHTINRLLALIGVFFILFCIISSLLYDGWTSSNQKVWYLPYVIGISTGEKLANFFVYVPTIPPEFVLHLFLILMLHLFLNLILPSQILHFVQQFYSYISLCNN